MSGICKWRGCNEPSIVGKRGHMTDYCAQHLPAMQAKWRGKDKLKREEGDVKRAAKPAEVIPGTSIPKPPLVPYTPVLVLRLCPTCGRAFWLKPGATLTCACAAEPEAPTLALVMPETGEVTRFAAHEVDRMNIKGRYAAGIAELLHAGLRVAIPVDESIHPVV